MAVLSSSPTAFLTRSGTYLNPNADWTVGFWYRLVNTTPTGGSFRNPWVWGDPANTDPYIAMFLGPDNNNITLEIFDGTNYHDTATFTLTVNIWYYFVVTYNSTSHTVSFYYTTVALPLTLIGTLSIDISGIVFVEKTEQVIVKSWADHAICYHRVWQRMLSAPEINAEKIAKFAVSSSSLLADTHLPNPSYETDDSGHGNDWTSGDGTEGWMFSALDTLISSVPPGAILITDFVWGPTAVLAADGTYLGIIPQGASDFGDITEDATMCIFDGNDSNKVVIYQNQITEIARVGPFGSNPRNITTDHINNFLVATAVGSSAATIHEISKLGVVSGTTWTLPGNSANLLGLGVSLDLSILYYSSLGSSAVHAYSLTGNVALPDLAAARTNYNPTKDIHVLLDNTILVGYHSAINGQQEQIIRYTAGGTVLNTYNLGLRSAFSLNRFGRGADDPISFWTWIQNNPSSQPIHFNHLVTSSGSQIASLPETEAGQAGDPDKNEISNSCPILLARSVTPGGIYKIVTNKRDDTLYTGIVKIPDPSFKTGLIGG